MNKKFLRIISIILSVMVIFGCAITASADDTGAPETITVTVRVEGLSKQLAERKVTVSKLSTVKAIVDSATIGVTYYTDSTKISHVMTEAAVTASEWQFAVDGVIKAEAIDAVRVDKDCEIVLYNASPDAVMPSFVADEVASTGVVKFNGTNKNGVTAPIEGATVTWETKSGEKEFITDAKGNIYIGQEDLTKGAHDISISKINEYNVPVVVRLDDGAEVDVAEIADSGDSDRSVFTQIYEFLYDILKGVIDVWVFYFSEIGKLFGIGK